ncbi:MAG: hypothetical protein ABI383_09890, partial [Acidobacteriaceae bacterium]
MDTKVAVRAGVNLDEIAEWIEAFDEVIAAEGANGGAQLLEAISRYAREAGVEVPGRVNTAYANTIPVEEEVRYPGD